MERFEFAGQSSMCRTLQPPQVLTCKGVLLTIPGMHPLILDRIVINRPPTDQVREQSHLSRRCVRVLTLCLCCVHGQPAWNIVLVIEQGTRIQFDLFKASSRHASDLRAAPDMQLTARLMLEGCRQHDGAG